MKIVGDINKIHGQDNVQDIRKKKDVKGTEKFDEILKTKEKDGAGKVAEEKSGAAGRADRVQISSEAEKVRFVQEVVRKTPDIRADKVDKIKALIKEGKYDVSAEDLAQKLIDSGVADKLLRG